MARHDEQAIEQERENLELDDRFAPSHWGLGLALEQKGKFAEAIAEFQKAITLDPNPQYYAALGHAYAVAGRKGEALEVLDRLSRLSRQKNLAWNEVAVLYAGLRETDKALAMLDIAYKTHDGTLNWLKVDPRFDALHSDPRYTDLLKRMGLMQ